MATKSTTAERPREGAEPGRLLLVCALAWLIPGAGHLFLGRRQKGLIFLVARLMEAGSGNVTAASYEYGNTFLMTAGLLNFLVILDAIDIAYGRK